MEKDERNEAGAQAAAEQGATRRSTMEGQREEKDLVDETDASASRNSISANEDGSAQSLEDPVGGAPVQDAPPASPEASRTNLQTSIIMASLCASVFLAALDVTIVATALPTISEHFHSNAGYTWVGSAYLLANAASTPSWGKFSDIWGRKPILLCAAGVFFLGSVLAATSVNIGMLITARAIQGIGGGGLIILVNISISDLFSMRNRGKYFGMVGGVWALASALGPLLGGVFTEKVSWRWCFYINLPITATVFVLLCIFLHLDNPKTPVWDGLKAVDWAGSLTIVGGTLMLLLGLEFGGVTYPWGSAKVICLIVFGIVVAGLFILNEWKFARYPVMPLRLFKHRSNVASLGVCFCHGFVFIAGTYFLPLYFQAVLGATPLLSGVYLLPFAMSLSVVSGGAGVFIKKTGKYLPPIWFGLVFMTIGTGLFIDLDARPNWAKIIIFQIIAGIGVGPNFQSPLIALQSMVPPRDIATATATFGFVRNLSTSISVVIGGVVFQNEMQKRYSSLVAALGPSVANELSGASAGSSVGLVKQLPPASRVIAREAFNSSLRTMWIMYVAFAGLGVFISLFIGNQKLSKEHTVTKTGLAEEEAKRKEMQEKKRQSKEMLREEKRAEKDAARRTHEVESGVMVPKEEV
ncbi:efflux pump dotC [Hyphodiscus hymeniophilus]|uniref:Efflux pump dotC n=1 Tax=Hyphodiscus hymeniophilus TaxID=353542 RepID=A0A9P7B0K9_9HELO|nr:efflux pump dotC [Hyphodiscus hymeniophilus]